MTGVIRLSMDEICGVTAHGSDPCGEPSMTTCLLLSQNGVFPFIQNIDYVGNRSNGWFDVTMTNI